MWVSMHFTALFLGLGSWAVCAIAKLTGPKLINAMPEFGEDEEALEKAQNFNKRAMAKVTFAGTQQTEA